MIRFIGKVLRRFTDYYDPVYYGLVTTAPAGYAGSIIRQICSILRMKKMTMPFVPYGALHFGEKYLEGISKYQVDAFFNTISLFNN